MRNLTNPDRKITPENKKVAELLLNEPTKITLSNGMEMFLIESGLEDVVRIDIVVNAGSAFQEKSLCASFTNSLLKEGIKGMNAMQIAEMLDFHGSYLSTSISKDKATITLFSITKHLNKLLPLLKNIVAGATFPENEFSVHRDRSQQEFLVNSQKAKQLANRNFNNLIFGSDSPYGRVAKEQDYNSIEKDDLTGFYKSFYQPKNSYLIVSGRPDTNSIKLMEEVFGNQWQNNEIPFQTPVKFSSEQTKGKKLVTRDDFLQSAIRIGKTTLNKFDKDYSKLLITNTILGGYFGSRLMSNLREDKGMTYGVSSFISSFLHGSYFAVATEVNITQTQAAITEINKEIEKLQNNKIGHEELSLVKNYIYGNFLKNFDGPFALAEMFRSAHDFGLNFDFYNKSLNMMMETTADEILRTAQINFDMDEMATLVVGNRE